MPLRYNCVVPLHIICLLRLNRRLVLLLHNHRLLDKQWLCPRRDRSRGLAGLDAAADGPTVLGTQHQKRAHGAQARDIIRAWKGERADTAAAMLLAQAARLGANQARRAADALVVAAVATAATAVWADLTAQNAEA